MNPLYKAALLEAAETYARFLQLSKGTELEAEVIVRFAKFIQMIREVDPDVSMEVKLKIESLINPRP